MGIALQDEPGWERLLCLLPVRLEQHKRRPRPFGADASPRRQPLWHHVQRRGQQRPKRDWLWNNLQTESGREWIRAVAQLRRFAQGALLEGSDHALYGTTKSGRRWVSGSGTVFRVDRDGSGYKVITDFSDTGVWWPDAPLVEGSDQALYGTTFGGAVFKLHKDGSGFTSLAQLGYAGELGSFHSALVEALDGALYGTAFGRSSYIYRLSKDDGELSILHTFVLGTDGIRPKTGLILGSDGLFYGVAEGTGYTGDTLYRLWPPQTPDLRSIATGSGVQVTVTGVGGNRYQLSRATNLVNWSALTTFNMPETGAYTYTNGPASNSRTFYRVAWVP